MSRASSVPEITRARIPVCCEIAWRNSPPFSASRTALVATATVSSTLCDSARRRNFDRTWSAACIASGGAPCRPSPPAPRRTICFSRSITSNDRSGRTRTTIMCTELVPMSMAASASRLSLCPVHHYNQGFRRSHTTVPTGVTTCFEIRLDRFTTDVTWCRSRGRPAPSTARGASRRSRELCPCSLEHPASRKLNPPSQELTRRLGKVREPDVLIELVDELQKGRRIPIEPCGASATPLAEPAKRGTRPLVAQDVAADLKRVAEEARGHRVEARSAGSRSVARRGWRWAI